ncbi:divergent polysaccharide deacetylase family protein [uncultured Shewanella sp.]|uniref:divergent polysaccharide deacetylase family protein n=1 Tax=uncultured Shewanella sp. TaxID=173975 RepID=UPI00261FEFC3|nr:divergent polysaccharide deacetylase family protein [uncultured Shewanella sp.]
MRSLLIVFIAFFSVGYVEASQVAIIIDDIGYRQSDEAVLSLPNNVTLSVLPHTPLGTEVAKTAHDKGYEIMLHLPMQALNGKLLGPGGLTNTMDESELKATLARALDNVPYAKGANNHMGSLLTQLDEPMQWVMESLKQRELYFVDSMTTRFTKASGKAELLGIPLLRRQVFLDNDISDSGLEASFKRLMSLAHKQGQVVVIAHPYPETIKFLNENLPRLEKAGIELVKTSYLLPYNLANKEKKGGAASVRLR